MEASPADESILQKMLDRGFELFPPCVRCLCGSSKDHGPQAPMEDHRLQAPMDLNKKTVLSWERLMGPKFHVTFFSRK